MTTEKARNLENAVIVTVAQRDCVPTEDEIRDLASALRAIPDYAVTDDEYSDTIRRLHARLQVTMDTGSALVEEHKSWLRARKPAIDPFFWTRFENHLTQLGWPPRVLTTLDGVTDDILDLLGDPLSPGSWRRRGLVMGDVQSGKTSTYAALCCKAADAGYRLIILLTGTLETLRRQTQERLDASFVGLDSSEFLKVERARREVGVGLLDRRRMAVVFTSKTRDFRAELVNQLGFRLREIAEPILLVVKKNKRILQNLETWLRAFNADTTGHIDTPLLLIDDEADNASVNTRAAGESPAAINERIRMLLHLFRRSNYVGFTATPFANIFIDPDTEDEMRGSDLFPRDFIYGLEAPTNYVGALAVFGENAELDCIRSLEDATDVLPQNHRIDLKIEELPPSLGSALETFIVSNAIRDLRGEGPTHRSMLVNVSRFTRVQNEVAGLLADRLRQVQQDIRNYSQLDPEEALANRSIAGLFETWGHEYRASGPPWGVVQPALLRAALPIVVRAVNQTSSAASLDYAAHRQDGLRVVAVGGNGLSRGLTLEGLCVSYFLRNTQMYDTLMQMGRWFGYRDGYADLCRIWISDEATSWYAHIGEATNELREEIRQMCAARLTPKDFGLRVRSHPDSLIVTARNKMRTAQEIVRLISVSNRLLETYRLRSDQDSIRANAAAARDFLSHLAAAPIARVRSPMGNAFWSVVPKGLVAGLLRRFVNHPLNISFETKGKDLADWIESTGVPQLQEWDVVLPNGDGAETEFGGVRYCPQERQVTINAATRAILVSGQKARVGSRGIEREGLPLEIIHRIRAAARAQKRNPADKEYRSHRSRPLLLLHLLSPRDERGWLATGGEPLVALGLSFPPFDDRGESQLVRYRVNLVELRALWELEQEDEEVPDDDPN